MKFENTDIGLNIVIEEDLINQIYSSCLTHYPNEFGGLLVGFYSEDRKTVFVQDTILPKKYKSSKFSFDRDVSGLKKVLKALFNKTPRIYYIGEWHSHPDNPAIPSTTDLNAFHEISSHDNVYIENPVLLIMSVFKAGFDFNLYVYYNQKFNKYEKN